jgi:hypothetical protein
LKLTVDLTLKDAYSDGLTGNSDGTGKLDGFTY